MAPTAAAKLKAFHAYRDSVRWRVTPRGVAVEGKGVERTPGDPVTATKVWDSYHDQINAAATRFNVPAQLILATICTESGGRADAIRLEPRFVSDQATPDQVSPGLMQTLISTARWALGDDGIDRKWLFVPGNSVMAGTAVIAKAASATGLDPPLVGAAYNAGSLRYNQSAQNRWRTVQYPIGTSQHVDRFVKWFNDGCFVLARSPVAPTVGLERLIGVEGAVRVDPARAAAGKAGAAAKAARQLAAAKVTVPPVAIGFGPNARKEVVSPKTRAVLQQILRSAGLKTALITSTQRTPADQARAMFQNLEAQGVAAQKALYGPNGDAVIDVYAAQKKAGKSAGEIMQAMTDKIVALGPGNVSHHAADPSVLNVIDIAPTSIANPSAFEAAVAADGRVKLFLKPPSDPAYHLEIPQ